MSSNAICENKILAKIFEFTVKEMVSDIQGASTVIMKNTHLIIS